MWRAVASVCQFSSIGSIELVDLSLNGRTDPSEYQILKSQLLAYKCQQFVQTRRVVMSPPCLADSLLSTGSHITRLKVPFLSGNAYVIFGVAVISAKNYKRQRRKRQSETAEREKSQTPKVLTAILTLPNLT